MPNPAPIFTDTFALCEWLLQRLDREQGVLARTICNTAVQFLEVITFALRDRRRDERLDEADERLIALRMRLRLAGAIGLLDEQQVLFALAYADRIGRQLGGWQRARNTAY